MFSSPDLTAIYFSAFGGSIIVVLVLLLLIKRAVVEIGGRSNKVGNRLMLAIVIWPLLALLVGLTVELDFPVLGGMLIVPLLIGTVALRTSSISKILARIPLHSLVTLSVYRVVGALFLYLYFSGSGALSRGFAMNAGWGDVITGIMALPVAWLVWKQLPFAKIALLAWTLFGIGDLILAPASAFMFGAEKLVEFPLVFIPIFLGPPFGIFLHLLTLRVAWLQGRLTTPSNAGKIQSFERETQ